MQTRQNIDQSIYYFRERFNIAMQDYIMISSPHGLLDIRQL